MTHETRQDRLSCAVLFFGAPETVAKVKNQLEDTIRLSGCNLVHVQLSKGRLFITTGREENGEVGR